MTILQRIARNPVAIVGLGTALYGVLVAFGLLELSAEQTGALTSLAGAVFFALRWLVTPASEVVVQQKPGELTQTAGEASDEDTGAPVYAHVTRILGKA